jgi:hypothetical protein
MDAKDIFNRIVAENYKEFKSDPMDLRKLWNAVVSMNTVAESLALDQANYPSLLRKEVDQLSAAVRARYPDLKDIKVCAETLKHVRHHVGQKLTASSTGILPEDPNTWEISVGSTSHKLVETLDRAFATLGSVSEFK